jgi:hypothetical protein
MFQAIPVLHIFDLGKAKEFLRRVPRVRDRLGASFEEDAPVYVQISRGDLVLHLSEHHGDACPGSTVFVRTTHLEDFNREVTAKAYRFMRSGIELTPWHSNLLDVTDPFGNRIRFNEDSPGGAAAHQAQH